MEAEGPATESWSIAFARKSAGLSQAQLGKLLHQRIRPGSPFSVRAYQNLISSWERGRARPSKLQMEALAVIFKTDVVTIRRGVDAQTTKPVLLRVLDGLARDGSPSLMVVCSLGETPGDIVPAFLPTVRQAIRRGLCLAVVSPYYGRKQIDFHYILNRVSQHLATTAREGQMYVGSIAERGLDEPDLSRLSFVIPIGTMSNPGTDRPWQSERILPTSPPLDLSYVFVLTRKPEGLTTALYVWLGQLGDADLVPIEVPGGRRAQTWQSYFHDIVEAWHRAKFQGFEPGEPADALVWEFCNVVPPRHAWQGDSDDDEGSGL